MALLFLILVAGFAITWLSLAISIAVDGHRLFLSFREKYPVEASRKMKEVFTGMRHPSKTVYFLKKDSRVFLASQNDSVLLALRDKFARMTWTLLGLHFGAMAFGILCAAILK